MSNDATSRSSQPIQNFARFFRAYNVGLSLIVAAIPVAIAVWDLVPMFTNNKGQLTLITSVGSYLLVGFIFQQRTAVGRLYFPQGSRSRSAYAEDLRRTKLFSLLPLLLLVTSLLCFYLYFLAINSAIQTVAYRNSNFDEPATKVDRVCETLAKNQKTGIPQVDAVLTAYGLRVPVSVRCGFRSWKDGSITVEAYDVQLPSQAIVSELLARTPMTEIPVGTMAATLFLSAFLCLTAAFILMGLKEYMQERLGILDEDLINDRHTRTRRKRFDLIDVPGAYGYVEYNPNDPSLEPKYEGPLCIQHNWILEPAELNEDGSVRAWQHTLQGEKGPVRVSCTFSCALTGAQLDARLEDSGSAFIARERTTGTLGTRRGDA